MAFYSFEENGIMHKEEPSIAINDQISGNGSEAQLKSLSLSSQVHTIVHSSQSSVNPVISINASNNSLSNNMTKIIYSNLKVSNNSSSNNNEIGNSKNEDSFLFDNNFKKNDEEKKVDINNKIEEDEKVNDDLLAKLMEKLNNKSYSQEFEDEVIGKVKEGYIPYFIKIKSMSSSIYYAKPDSNLKTGIDHYILQQKIRTKKDIDITKYSFYYNNELVDINSIIGELGLEPLSKIYGKIK